MEATRRVSDYFVIAGLPKEKEKLQLLDEFSLEVNLKPSAYQDPITDITVIFPSLGENVPDYFQLIDATPSGQSANLNHGSFRSPEVFICFRRDRKRPPLIDIGVLYDGKERVMPDSQIVEFTHQGTIANVNNATNSNTYLTYRRATETSPCNELVVMDICVIVASKGEVPPHSFMKIDKNLNKGMTGSDVYICYKKSINRADLISYKPAVLSRFPLKDNPAYRLEDTVALFCLPMGATLECWPTDSVRSSAVNSTFVLTLANRSKVYGSAITFYEEVNEDAYGLTDDQKKLLELKKYRNKSERKIFTNKCICILSRWPFFDAFEKFLFFLHKRQLMGPFDIPLEHFISHFLYNVPFPSPSRPRILLQLSTDERIAFSQPEELPLPRSGASFRQLLLNLGPDNCLLVLLLALTEQKILLHSLRPAVLTAVSEAVMQIIFPFYWQCPYIPLCPIGMSDYLSAPLPFVIGLDSRFFDLYDQPSDVNAVDLDTRTVTVCEEKCGLSYKLLPKKAARTLKHTLQRLNEKCIQYENYANKMQAHLDDGAIDVDFTLKKKELQLELEIREAFLHFTVSILAGYKHYLLPITKEPTVGATDVNNLFDQTAFLRSRDRNFHKFYVMLMRSQMFTKFIEERSFVSETNMCLAFFDECVDKLLLEEDPKFLELEGMDSDRTVFILPPDPTESETSPTENFELDPQKFIEKGNEEDDHDFKKPITDTPASLARRTNQEIRSAQKLAKRHQNSGYLWAKCLLNTTYSLWFIHLPGFSKMNEGNSQTLRVGLTLLQRIKRLRLYPADEICYRVMMQLCGAYNQPILAVKVLFEMGNIGLLPNAVTYGYYNKAVLESKWPSGGDTKTGPQRSWDKLRLVLLGISIFKRVSREKNFLSTKYKSVSTTAMNNQGTSLGKKDDFDGVSQVSQTSSDESEATAGLAGEEFQQEKANLFDSQNDTDPHQSSDNQNSEVKESTEEPPDEGLKMMKRMTSIVKTNESVMGAVETEVATEEVKASMEKNLVSDKEDNDQNKPRSDTKGSNEVNQSVNRKVNRSLFQDESTKIERSKSSDSANWDNQIQNVLEEKDISQEPSELISEKHSNEEVLSHSCSEPVQFKKTPSNSSLRSPLVGTPLKENDPLGALVTPSEQENSQMTKSATLPTGDMEKNAAKIDDNILGSPFSDEKLNKSSTMPSNTSTPISAFTSFRSLTKGVHMSTKLSKLKNSSMSITSYLSPNTATSKKTQEALNTGITSVKSFYSNVSKRVEEMREGLQVPSTPGMSPAGSTQYLSTPDRSRDDDSGSTHSADSRRPSADPGFHYMNEQSDTWSSFTGAIWDQFWGGTQDQRNSNSNQQQQRKALNSSAIFDLFDSLYSSMPKKLPGPEAMEILMTSCSRCSGCQGILYDEEIMSGWTAEDSNLNTKCSFCQQMVVPFLTIKVIDYRATPLTTIDMSNKEVPAVDEEHPSPESESKKPQESEVINVPYISPLVLRKELENWLLSDGDQCLLDSECVDSHPIIFWNLIWYFERIAVKSYLPGHCLKAKSLNNKPDQVHPTWNDASHRNISIRCNWDNSLLHESQDLPLYSLWHQNDHSLTSGKEHIVVTGDQNPAYRGVMQHIISGVQNNDLIQPLKTMLERRQNIKSPQTPPASPSKCQKAPRSIYREVLFLTLISLGQDNIDLTAFDREYRRAFDNLPKKYDAIVHPCDRPPNSQMVFCRNLFRGLKL